MAGCPPELDNFDKLSSSFSAEFSTFGVARARTLMTPLYTWEWLRARHADILTGDSFSGYCLQAAAYNPNGYFASAQFDAGGSEEEHR